MSFILRKIADKMPEYKKNLLGFYLFLMFITQIHENGTETARGTGSYGLEV